MSAATNAICLVAARLEHDMKRICVFTGSRPGLRPEYAHAVASLGRELVSRDIELVYGGAHTGLMGVLADATLEAGGHVIGVIPKALLEKEKAHQGLRDLRVVNTMHERKALMAALSDGFIAAPGGMGTLDELFEMLTWSQLGLHEKPCGLLNTIHYYEFLLQFLQRSVEEKLIPQHHSDMIIAEEDAGIMLDRFLRCFTPRLD